jgi:hypothetical protein
MLTLEELLARLPPEVNRFADAVRRAPADELSTCLRRKLESDHGFPNLLGIYLTERGLGLWNYCDGAAIDKTGQPRFHRWLEGFYGVIVDLTADQYAGFPPGPLVTPYRDWHESIRHPLFPSEPAKWDESDDRPGFPGDRSFRESYATVLAYMRPAPCGCSSFPSTWGMTIRPGPM